jgi:hypothetical protein
VLGRKWQKRGWISPILQGLDFPDFAGLDFPDFLPRCVNGAWKEVESKDINREIDHHQSIKAP